jgi:hypothetical protein
MDFNLTEEQLMIQQAARDFAQSELLPELKEMNFQSSHRAGQKNGRAWFYGNDG